MPKAEIDISRLSGFSLNGIPPCPRLHAGGSDHLSRVMVIIPRVQLGGIQPCLRLHAGGSDHLSRMMVIIP